MSGCSITATINSGSISQLIIENGGSGYIRPPNVFIDPPESGSDQATALVSDLSNNTVYKILLTNSGSGYESSPNVYVQDAVIPSMIPGIRGWDMCPNDNPYSPYRVISSYYLSKFFQQYLPPTCVPGLILSSGDYCNQWVDSISLSSLNLIPQTAPPTVYTAGTLYYDNNLNQLRYWNGSIWVNM